MTDEEKEEKEKEREALRVEWSSQGQCFSVGDLVQVRTLLTGMKGSPVFSSTDEWWRSTVRKLSGTLCLVTAVKDSKAREGSRKHNAGNGQEATVTVLKLGRNARATYGELPKNQLSIRFEIFSAWLELPGKK